MVAPALIVAAQLDPGHAGALEGAAARSAALLIEFGGDDDAALDAARRRAERGARGPTSCCVRSPSSDARRR